MSRTLEREGYKVEEAPAAMVALTCLDTQPYDAVLTDLLMPDMDGLELLLEIRKRDADVPVIIMTGMPDMSSAMRALEYGANQYLIKPAETGLLVATINRLVRHGRLSRLRREAEALLRHSTIPFDVHSLKKSFASCMDSLWMAYQPIVRAADGQVAGYEALMRSKVPELPHPGAMLDAAERLNRLQELGRIVRGRAAEPYLGDPVDGLLFVNLHPTDLEDLALRSQTSPLSRIASQVVLEITERASLDHKNDLREQVAELREMGFRIAVDDIGAGYAGLSTFALLEPDIVKLDMSLVRGIDSNATKRRIVASLKELCQQMNILVVAEGVETEAERQTVTELGCDLLQGYLFAKPGPAFPEISIAPS